MKVSVKWNGQVFEGIEFDATNGTGLQLKESVYRATGVEPERQKIIVKGTILKDDAGLDKLSLTDGSLLVMMGTPQNKFKPVEQTSTSSVANSSLNTTVESQDKKIKLSSVPVGFVNLGNTCYFNAVLQVIFSLRPKMNEFFEQHSNLLSKEINSLYLEAEKKPDVGGGETAEAIGITPLTCLRALRSLNSQFAQIGDHFIPMQQDAEECLSFIFNQIPSLKELFKMNIEETLVNENDAEDGQTRTDSLYKLHSMITANVNNLTQGINEFLHTKLMKMSPKTNQEHSFNSTITITKSPQFLLVQMGRFSFRQDSQKGTKILKKVSFPIKLNIREFCSEDNSETEFTLKAVITHKGRSLTSGHYIAWCLDTNGKWVKYDDDKVDFVTEDEIKALDGGGDWHMSYLLFYERNAVQ